MIFDIRAYCSVKKENVGVLSDCQFCECDCLRRGKLAIHEKKVKRLRRIDNGNSNR